MQVDGHDTVTDFHEKPKAPTPLPGTDRALASMGIYLFNTAFLYRLLREDALRADLRRDFGHDIFPALIHRTNVRAHRYSRSCVNMVNGAPYWRDVEPSMLPGPRIST